MTTPVGALLRMEQRSLRGLEARGLSSRYWGEPGGKKEGKGNDAEGASEESSDSSHTEVPSLGIGNATGVQPGYEEASGDSASDSDCKVELNLECRLQMSIPKNSPLSEGRGESERGLGPARTQTSVMTNPLAKKGEGRTE